MRIPEGLRLRFMGLLAAALLAGCSLVPFGEPEPIPTEAEARTFLAEIVALARSGDFDGLCARGSNCRQALDSAGRDAVPPDPPLVVGTRRIEHEQRQGGWSVGGIVLQVCGIDGRGDAYDGEVMVLRSEGTLTSIGTVYWSGTRIATSNVVGAPRGPAPAGCPPASP
jgi:hypothetical protein